MSSHHDSRGMPLMEPAPHKGATLVFCGGSFDPPHQGHAAIARAAQQAAGPGAWIVFVPAARSPHKHAGPAAADSDRIAMLRLMASGLDDACIWTDEIDRAAWGEASYTIDSVRRLREVHPIGEIRLLIGADQARAFARWRAPHDLLKLAPPLIARRGDDAAPLLEELRTCGAWSDEELRLWEKGMLDSPLMDVSSTALREALRGGRSGDLIDQWIDPTVLMYITARGLYL